MGPISYDKVEFKIGDLVEFRGYNYSPDSVSYTHLTLPTSDLV